MNLNFSSIRLCVLARRLHIVSTLRPAMSSFDMEEKLFSLSANGQLAELKGLTTMSKTNINASNTRGWTALMFAARNGHADAVKLLIENGAQPETTNSLGQTAYDIASFWSHQPVMSILGSVKSDNTPQELVNFFTVKGLNRASEMRKDSEQLMRLLTTDPSTRILVMVNAFPLIQLAGKAYNLKLCEYVKLKQFIDVENFEQAEVVFLGKRRVNDEDGGPLFAVNISVEQGKELMAELKDDSLSVLERIRGAFMLDVDEAALAGLAHSLFDWHHRYRYCPSCGSQTKFADAGYKRTCTNNSCISVQEVKNTSYPRLDPTIIVAVTSSDRNRLLLARGRKFLPKMWSCLAGFMEPGESIEDACRREVYEEAGVRVGHISYHSSQPWPFPTQLMIGLVGQASTDDIFVDKNELDDARWFSRADVIKMMMRSHPEGYVVPPHQAIAHQLIKNFLHETSSKM